MKTVGGEQLISLSHNIRTRDIQLNWLRKIYDGDLGFRRYFTQHMINVWD